MLGRKLNCAIGFIIQRYNAVYSVIRINSDYFLCLGLQEITKHKLLAIMV